MIILPRCFTMARSTEHWIKDYSYYLKIERRMSPNTVASYCSDISKFLDFCESDPKTVDSDSIVLWLQLCSKTVGKRSQAHELSSLRSFFDYLIMEGERKDNPCDRVDSPKLGRYLPAVLSIEEIDAIMNSVDLSSWNGSRDRSILEFLYGCGLRVSEACNLRISQVYLKDRFVRVIGKGNKERLVPFGRPAADAFEKWLATRPEPFAPEYDDYAFLNKFGKPISRVAVFKMIKTQALRAGVNKEISPHTFRHSFATHLIANGADLRIVQEMLGHESILTTEIYTHIDAGTWQRSILEHHPRG